MRHRPPTSTLFPYTTLFRSFSGCACPNAKQEKRSRHRAPRRKESRRIDRKSTRLNSSHVAISYAVFCLKKKNDEERGETASSRAPGEELPEHRAVVEAEGEH